VDLKPVQRLGHNVDGRLAVTTRFLEVIKVGSLDPLIVRVMRLILPFVLESQLRERPGLSLNLALLTNGKGFIGLETGFDYVDPLASVGVGLRHQVHADHEAARNGCGIMAQTPPGPESDCESAWRLTPQSASNRFGADSQ
jgi:hypothetical protein